MNASRHPTPPAGLVVIGRNEGERLMRCLASAQGQAEHIVYVDSGSTDGSREAARDQVSDVVLLDPNRPFSAARARNEGWRRLLALAPHLPYIQFVDGDCTLDADWMTAAVEHLGRHERTAAVCGRRREMRPEASVYNRLCDLEWDTPVGEARSCGGDAMFRAAALVEVGGYDPLVVAGEEPELCFRLRQRGYRIERLPHEMTRHDAAMTRVSQWWMRAVRSGYAYAQAAALHGRSPERFGVRPSLSIWTWALVVPLLALGAAWPTGGWSLLVLLAYPLGVLRIARGQRARGRTLGDALLYAGSCVLAKWPQLQGQVRFLRVRGREEKVRPIEYKGPDAEGTATG